jgi:hypothetical protein
MDRIHKLPFITGGFMAVLIGAISYACGSGSQTTYIRMAVVMVGFYIIGVYVRNTLKSINAQLEEKKEQELLKELEAAEAEAAARHAEQAAEKQPGGVQGSRVNLVADDSADEFTPLTVSQVISSKIKE